MSYLGFLPHVLLNFFYFMPKSVLSRPKVSHSQGRNAFDRSYVRNFHLSAGMIIPVMMEPCVAGTKGVINRRIFTRGVPVIAPAFQDVQQHFDFFKVPMRLLLSTWNDWKLNINDIGFSTLSSSWLQSQIDLSLPVSIPRCDFGNSFARRLDNIMVAAGYSNVNSRVSFINNASRLLEQLGYGSNLLMDYSPTPVTNSPNVQNLFPLAAYQKVYYDHYRNSTYEYNNPFAYNLDYLYAPAIGNQGDIANVDPGTEWVRLRDMLTLRYVNYRNDYFHNIYPSLNYAQTSPNGSSWVLPSDVVGVGSNYQSNIGAVLQSPTYNGSYWQSSNDPSVQAATRLTVQSIRGMFALDKLLRASAYTPKHVRDQFKARFGVDVGSKVSHESERIGSFYHTINFGEVTNQAASSQFALGEIAGKAIGADNYGGDLSFYCEEDSIIIGVSYILPRAMYDACQDPWNANLVREDFFQPEFQNLGLRPIYAKFISGASGANAWSPNAIVGYTVPNQRYKLGRDMNFGEFKVSSSVFTVVSGSPSLITGSGFLQPFSVHTDFSGTFNVPNQLGASYFKVRPQDLDPIFVTAYDSVTQDPRTDHFFSNVQIKFAVTQPMDVHGQPYL